jgi:ABC-type uncharacterized transport system ATPase subunit
MAESPALISPAEWCGEAWPGIPEDRHKTGPDWFPLSLWKNWVIERYRDPPNSRGGGSCVTRQIYQQAHTWLQTLRRAGAPRVGIRGRRFQMPSATAVRRKYAKKVILSRELCRDPQVIVAHQPNAGTGSGGCGLMCMPQLLAAARAGAGIPAHFLKDLDELLSLADRVAVLYRGRLFPQQSPTQNHKR